MSTTIHFSLVSNPQLLDVVDEQWMQDKLEDDGVFVYLAHNKQTIWTGKRRSISFMQCAPVKLWCIFAGSGVCMVPVQTSPYLKAYRRHQLTWMIQCMPSRRASSLKNGATWDCSQCTDAIKLNIIASCC